MTGVADAQVRVSGHVIGSHSRAPIGGAVVTRLPTGHSTSTDHAGRFRLLIAPGDTLVVAAVGYHPDSTIVTTTAGSAVLRIELTPSPLPLADVIVNAEGQETLAWTEGRWRVPAATARSVPFAVEPDVYRSLSLIPAVSFSTVLSARPLIRGYDAGHTSLKIDGIEAAHPYHVGRAFSAFPLDATEEVSVTTSPGTAGREGGIAGDVDIQGRSGPSADSRGGADLTFGSASAWYGGGNRNPVFGAARVATLSIANQAVPGEIFPYWFTDFYGSLTRGDRLRGSVFLSRDKLGDRGRGTGVDWSTALAGARVEVARGPNAVIDLNVEATRYGLDVLGFPVNTGGRLDARNRYSRVAAGLDLTASALSFDWSLGAVAGYREIVNDLFVVGPDQFSTVDVGRAEAAFHVQASRGFGPVGISAGARLDQAGALTALQPRFRVGARITPGIKTSLSLGRTARLFHLLSSPSAQPDLDFLDYWLPAGESGYPVPRVDHAVADVAAQQGSVLARLSGYWSQGSGVGEVCAEELPVICESSNRFGRSRTSGLELQVALRGTEARERALSVSYALSFSERNFGLGWSRWALDRRHTVRIFGQLRPKPRWSVGASLEVASGLPLTPVEHIISMSFPGQGFSVPRFIFGKENSVRAAGTARMDVASRWQVKGPWGTRLTVGASITNLTFGPVGPMELDFQQYPAIAYKRSFQLPPIPSLTFRAEF
jgi:hypothetical protein